MNTKYYWNIIAQKFINSSYKDNEVWLFLKECYKIKPTKNILKRTKGWIEYRNILNLKK